MNGFTDTYGIYAFSQSNMELCLFSPTKGVAILYNQGAGNI